MKYIVKNCPACMINPMFRTPDYFCNDIAIEERILHCDSRTNCLIKRMIDRCKEEQYIDKQHSFKKPSKDALANFSKEILDMFDIQEVEE